MTPGQIIALARDVAIVGALGFILWWIRTDGKNAVKVEDMQAVQRQLTENAQKQAQYAQESRDAEFQRAQDMAKVSSTIGAQRAPIVVVRHPTDPGAVSCNTPATSNSPASTGAAISAARANSVADVRPAINQFEQHIEGIVADCRAALAKWPIQ